MSRQASTVKESANGGVTGAGNAGAEFIDQWPSVGTLLGYVLILAQFVLILLVLQRFDIQTSGFRRAFYVAVPGFVINQFLPRRWRLPFFGMLSVGGTFFVLGGAPPWSWDLAAASWRTALLLGIGGVLIGICHLPIGLWKRVGLLVAVAAAVAALRSGLVGSQPSAAVWPVLAAMFMFRLFIYLYDLSTGNHRPTFSESVAYFFLLPNVALTLFPVVDFKTFCRSHYNEPALAIYQRGIRWMTRGVLQLLLYRVIDQLFSLNAEEVATGTDLIQFFVANLFLYVKVSGLFHLAVGLLLLFGFNLPETNHRYFLASSFSDYWRRVNIYWKDFMLKVFFYPMFFRLKGHGVKLALVLSTLATFAVTWALHLYQTWWLKGTASASWPDALFWLILGVLVTFTALRELKPGRGRRLPTSGSSVGGALRLALRTAGVFTCLCLLWSLWSTSSVSLWLSLWAHADWRTLEWGLAVLAGVMVATIVFEAKPDFRAWFGLPARVPVPSAPWYRTVLVRCVAPLLVVLACSHSAIQARFSDPALQPYWDVVNSRDSIAGADDAHGYYENLERPGNAVDGLQEVLTRQRAPRGYNGLWPTRPVQDYRFYEPLPSVHVQAYCTDYRTNRWGMRDRDYELGKPAGVVRIALLGSSQAMGFGVGEQENFKAVIERRLNREYRPAAGTRFEVMNFAVTRYSPLNQIAVLQAQVRRFQPDVVLLVIHSVDYDWLASDLPRLLRDRIPIPDPFLRDVLSKARVANRTSDVFAVERLRPYSAAVLGWTYGRLVEESRVAGAVPVAVYLPLAWGKDISSSRLAQRTSQVALAADAGFVVFDLSSVFDGRNRSELILPETFNHYSPSAHALIADALFTQLTSDPRVGLSARAARASAPGSSASLTAQADHEVR